MRTTMKIIMCAIMVVLILVVCAFVYLIATGWKVVYANPSADFDGSGTVDFADFLQFVSHYDSSSSRFDLDGDGTVGFSDFLIFVSHYGERSPALAYNIDLVFGEGFTPHQQAIVRRAAKRWEQVIVGDLEDMKPYTAIGTGYIDDISIDVATEPMESVLGWGGPITWSIGGKLLRDLPFKGKITLNTEILNDDHILFDTALHEMGHVFGIGSVWDDQCVAGDEAYFPGTLAVTAFDAVGGENYTGKKVPTESDCGHWRESVFGHELMTPTASHVTEPLSAITVQSLADIGYQVDVSQADAYSLPPPLSGKPVARQIFHWGDCIPKGPIYVSDENGRVIHIIEK